MPPTPPPVPRPSPPPSGDVELLERLPRARAARLAQVGRRIVGQQDVLDGILTAVFSGGHPLRLGEPGPPNTLLVHTVAQPRARKFPRGQFSPDLRPSDITRTEPIREDKPPATRPFSCGG